MSQKISTRTIFLTFGILAVSFLAAFYSFAWTEPSSAPPTGNVPTPVNVGLESQLKAGNLTVWALGVSAMGNALIVANGRVGVGTTEPSQKLDVQGGSINTSGKLKEGGNDLIPTGAILYFNLASCPSGWTAVAGAQGRYLVGLPSGGTLGGTAGTAMTNLENRPVGQHSHSITDPGHSHRVSGYNAAFNNLGFTTPGFGAADTDMAVTGITINNAGSVDGTNAPYIQFLVCQKD